MKFCFHLLFTCSFFIAGSSAFCQTAVERCKISLPSISFIGNSTRLTKTHEKVLQNAAKSIRNNPECQFSVIGYCSYSKYLVQRGALRVDAIIKYLVEKQGISRERFIPMYGAEDGDCPTVDLRVAEE